jgi:hypothetical protein
MENAIGDWQEMASFQMVGYLSLYRKKVSTLKQLVKG